MLYFLWSVTNLIIVLFFIKLRTAIDENDS